MGGVARFELATSRPPDARATKLRYTPITKLSIKLHKHSRGVTHYAYILRGL